MKLTLVEKIINRHALDKNRRTPLRSGDIAIVRPKHVMTHDNTSAIMEKFFRMGGVRVSDPRQPVIALDHDVQSRTQETLQKYTRIKQFADEQGIDFYPAGTGIGHQIMMEQGYLKPGSLVVASDSHANLYGAAGSLGTSIVRTDAAAIWKTGKMWWQVPPVVKCTLTNALRPGVSGKDIILALCGHFNSGEVLNHAVEFDGDSLSTLGMDDRMAIANMTTEWGAVAGLFPVDDVLRDYLSRRPRREPYEHASSQWTELRADGNATYAAEIEIDLATIVPHVAGPNELTTETPIPVLEARKIPIHKAYILSCVGGRVSDLQAAARVLEHGSVAANVELYVAAASAETQRQLEQSGHWQTLIDAGANVLPAACGPCIGLGRGLVAEGEVAISATNRNFRGRMGHPDGQVYLASPAVVAASALAGHICAPSTFESRRPRARVRALAPTVPALRPKAIKVLDGFPRTIESTAVFLPKNNITTDEIYAGRWTYRDDISPDHMAKVAFENYHGAFTSVWRKGDIIIAGHNFGAGSSREQAVTVLKIMGVPCVVAASFNATYLRNAIGNAFLCITCPQLVDHLLGAENQPDRRSIVRVSSVLVDFASSIITLSGREFPFVPLHPVAQAIIAAGGIERFWRQTAPADTDAFKSNHE
ncbi:MAG: 3-isopropylmalate dehydratase large subunit [Proteobacteria bacterium]|nr:3-isopropylmalate dehydratase large subunit [Pseudomonadota bacterium]